MRPLCVNADAILCKDVLLLLNVNQEYTDLHSDGPVFKKGAAEFAFSLHSLAAKIEIRGQTFQLLCSRSCLCWIQCQIYSVQSVTEVVTLGLLGG